MRQRILSVFVGIFFTMVTNAQISEHFSTGNLSSSWGGETSKFVLENEQLQLNDTMKTGSAYLSTYSTAIDNGSWEMHLQMKFKPSGSNLVRYYLTSNSPILNEGLEGYYLQIGNTNKQILLYRMKGTSSKKIGESVENRLDTSFIDLSLKVVRGPNAEWKVYSKLNDERQFSEEFSVSDSTYLTSSFTGIYCKYTKSNINKITFDDIIVEGDGEEDHEHPFIKSFTPTDTLLTIQFNEWINEDFFQLSMNPQLNFTSEWNNAHNQLSIRLNDSMESGQKYELKMDDIRDFRGNSYDTLVNFAHINEIEAHDLLFTEVLFVPNREGSEFVEIYNNSDKVLDLSLLKFSTRKANDSSLYSAKKIASEPCLIFPKEIKVLTNNKEGVTAFYQCEENAFVEMSSFPSLRNETGAIVLFRSTDSLIIDNFYYEAAMHEETVPNKGTGVSLERVSVDSDEWVSSASINGYATPGYFSSNKTTRENGIDDIRFDATEVCYPLYGEEHHFQLKYQLDAPNYIATIRVYHTNGMCVKEIIHNATLSMEGVIEWDGTDNNGRALSTAPYIVRMEAINAQSGRHITRSFVVLISR